MQRPLLGARECSNAHHPQTRHEVVAVEYFYTVDLGELHGRKMERLAEKAGFDDVEAFAALLLAYAVDQAGAWDRENAQADDTAEPRSVGAGDRTADLRNPGRHTRAVTTRHTA